MDAAMQFFKAIVRSRKFRVFAACLSILIASGALWSFTRCTLAEFVDRDLRNLEPNPLPEWKQFLAKWIPAEIVSPKARLNKALGRVLPQEYREKHFFGEEFGPQPWHLWRHQMQAESGLILFVCQPNSMVPSSAHVYVHFLNTNGQHLGCSDFQVGNRTDLVSAKLGYDEVIGSHLIELKTCHTLGGYDSRQFYAIRDQRVALLRIEDLKAEFIENYFYPKYVEIGPMPPVRTAEEWECVLQSSNLCGILEALMWIGGEHYYDDALGRRDVLATVRGRYAVRKRISELATWENTWVREAAIAAQRRL